MSLPTSPIEWLFLIASGLFGYAQFTTRKILQNYEDRLKKLEEYRDQERREIQSQLAEIKQSIADLTKEVAKEYMSKEDCISFHRQILEQTVKKQ